MRHLPVPENMHELIPDQLVPWRVSDKGGTPIYSIDGYPDLLVRHHRQTVPEDILDGYKAIKRAATDDIPVVPCRIYEADFEWYVAVAKVSGRLLRDALQDTPSPDLLRQTDGLHTKLGAHILKLMRQGGKLGGDIFEAHQYMTGTILDDAQPQLWLVDIPDSAINLRPHRDRDDELHFATYAWLNGCVTSEQLANTTFRDARAIARDLFDMNRTTPRGDEWAAVFQHALDTRQTLYYEGPPITDLRA